MSAYSVFVQEVDIVSVLVQVLAVVVIQSIRTLLRIGLGKLRNRSSVGR